MAVIIRTGDILVRRPLFPRSLLTIIPSSIHPSIPVTEAAAATVELSLSLPSSMANEMCGSGYHLPPLKFMASFNKGFS